MVYHRGGPTKPSLVIATWAGYKKAGPLLVSTEHKGTADGGALHLTFTNVAVKMAGVGYLDACEVTGGSSSGHYYSSATTIQLRQVAAGGHADLDPRTLSANDRTIGIGLQQGILQASSTCASAVAGVTELALLARVGDQSRLLEWVGNSECRSPRRSTPIAPRPDPANRRTVAWWRAALPAPC